MGTAGRIAEMLAGARLVAPLVGAGAAGFVGGFDVGLGTDAVVGGLGDRTEVVCDTTGTAAAATGAGV